MINVTLLNQAQTIFDGIAKKVILPGDYGEFEILPFHWPIVSILRKGDIVIDEMSFPISRGIARFSGDTLVALVDL